MRIIKIIGLQILGILLWLIYFPLNVASDILSKVSDWAELFTEPVNNALEDLLYSDNGEYGIKCTEDNTIES